MIDQLLFKAVVNILDCSLDYVYVVFKFTEGFNAIFIIFNKLVNICAFQIQIDLHPLANLLILHDLILQIV